CKHQYIMTTSNGDRVRAKIYKRGSIQFQGKYLQIASLINDFMCSILNMKEIVEQKNKEFNVDIKKETIESELHSKLPKSIDKIHEDIKKQLSCSLIMKKIDVEMEDYSTYCVSALRAIEGFIYQ
ncbi:type II toxin-antitoxin system mRNA endoribonuclease LsoA, partial [Klebsiella pneumoniae]|nr:type II toxin-antitoxin system mRNA endoribonuclease LsoA [Klebsiella pneumoniae]